jgi:hypothetical protein
MPMVLCPRSSCTVRMSTPAITSRPANVCRKQCQVKPSKPAIFTTGSNQRRGVFTGNWEISICAGPFEAYLSVTGESVSGHYSHEEEPTAGVIVQITGTLTSGVLQFVVNDPTGFNALVSANMASDNTSFSGSAANVGGVFGLKAPPLAGSCEGCGFSSFLFSVILKPKTLTRQGRRHKVCAKIKWKSKIVAQAAGWTPGSDENSGGEIWFRRNLAECAYCYIRLWRSVSRSRV